MKNYFFRKKCYLNKIKIINVKNSLLKKIFYKKKIIFKKILPILNNNSYIMFSNNINISAKIINNNLININNIYYPILKLAYVNNNFYYGNNNLNILSNIKSKYDLIKDIIINFKYSINKFLFFYINYKIINLFKIIKILYINKKQ
ncbi:MAG: hypothetical protein NHG07_00020 [Candidatus Shikimatogenerans bostrichidophilus]|nr:MAG: hypothetical protein NHG07_00020 [Candidatus Shikimatogenerans bostrichidophilus]